MNLVPANSASTVANECEPELIPVETERQLMFRVEQAVLRRDAKKHTQSANHPVQFSPGGGGRGGWRG